MKLNWNFLEGGGCKTKTLHGRSVDIFWIYIILTVILLHATETVGSLWLIGEVCMVPQGGCSGFLSVKDGGKNQNPKKSLIKDFQQNLKKSLEQKFTPKKSHAKFLSLKNFQKGLNDIISLQKKTLF